MVYSRGIMRFGKTPIEYQIRRSSRRSTVSIAIVPHEGVVVTAPERAPVERLDEIVRQKAPWITQILKRQSSIPPPLPEREFVSGEAFKYLGRQHRLKVETFACGNALVGVITSGTGAYMTLTLDKDLPDSERAFRARAALVEWYRASAREYLRNRAALWAPKLGLTEPRIRISEPKKRWGSASKDGTIRINWRILQAPVTLVDYVLVHELVHLIHADHSREFWATLGRLMPDYEDRKNRLRELGPELVW